jgi:hypothetical protein
VIRLVPATEAHIAEVSKNIRHIDREEIWAAGHMTPEESIRLGLKAEAWAAYFDDELACIIGCKPVTILSDVACPWMIATDVIERKPKTFLRHCRPIIDLWQERYALLVNYADDRNSTVKKWVQWLGFTLFPPEPYGFDGKPFCRFERTRDV